GTARQLLPLLPENKPVRQDGVYGALTEQTPFDVIVSDIGMPEIDGHKMMAIIRQQGANRDTPSIALTGYGTLRDVEKAMAAGFTLHLRKPIDLQALIDAVSQAVH
ncbi:response regulator, partial [Stutzerimonas stutzeri]|uniref:response regulator n=1 Tax=Stutzerimonas stutzeri TaxID=316 RepID=UPI0021AD93D2